MGEDNPVALTHKNKLSQLYHMIKRPPLGFLARHFQLAEHPTERRYLAD